MQLDGVRHRRVRGRDPRRRRRAGRRPGEVGEIVVRGDRGITLFAGYLDDPATTEASFRDGWFLTGDRATARRRSGRFFFDGRRSDVLKVAGENVSTVEVEAVVTAHPVGARGVGGRCPRSRFATRCRSRSSCRPTPPTPPSVDELARVVRRPARQGEGAPRVHDARRAAAHERRQDPQVPVEGGRHAGVCDVTDLTPICWPRSTRRSTDVATASTLPPELYTSDEVLAFEKEALFMREWVCVGRAERIPNPGDWFTVTIVDEPLIVVRDKDGAGALHVGGLSAPCDAGVRGRRATTPRSSVPYHHWIYGARRPPARRAGDGADRRLRQGRLGPAAAAGRGVDGLRVRQLRPRRRTAGTDARALHAVPRATTTSNTPCVPARSRSRTMPWNWKVMFENFNDGYHANRLHQYVQDFCPSNMSAFPEPWDDDSNVIFRTAGLHPHRRRLQRHPSGDHGRCSPISPRRSARGRRSR